MVRASTDHLSRVQTLLLISARCMAVSEAFIRESRTVLATHQNEQSA